MNLFIELGDIMDFISKLIFLVAFYYILAVINLKGCVHYKSF